MNETVLLKSGDIFFSPSAGGCTALLPSGKKLWLNEQIIEMYEEIQDLQKTLPGKDGKDGRSVEIKYGLWPDDSVPDLPENYYIQWKWRDRGTEVDTWKPLIAYTSLKGEDGAEGPEGPEGPPGPMGPQGTTVHFKGRVKTALELLDLTNVEVGDGYMVDSLGTLWVLTKQPPAYLGSWADLGKILGPQGPKGDKGARGPKGDRGPKGEDGGGISQFIIQWIIDSATSAAISGAMTEVSSMVNDAINDAINQLMSQMENMVEDAVEKAISDAMDELKGEKGDKGDKGDDGKDGASVRMVGHYELLSSFMTQYPAQESNVGVAALIGKEHEEKELWAVSAKIPVAGMPPHYLHENLGNIRGPKGEDAKWEVSIRDKAFTETKTISVESNLPSGVAGLYIQETDTITIEGLSGSAADPKQVGFRMSMRHPIPRPVKDDDPVLAPTKGLVLGNDGEKLIWVEGGSGGGVADLEVLLRGADGRVWSLNIDDHGNLHQDLSDKNTNNVVIQLKSPNGQKWGITIDNIGKINVGEVY